MSEIYDDACLSTPMWGCFAVQHCVAAVQSAQSAQCTVYRARLHFSAKPGFQTDQKAVLGNQLSSATLSNQRQVETLE